MDDANVKREAGAVYGTILVLAVVAAFSEDADATSGEILGAVLATSLVFWIVHVYATVLSRGAAGHDPAWRSLIADAGRHEWPLVQAAIAPAVPLLLGALGIFERDTAVTLALVVGVADLAIWGYASGRAMERSVLVSVLIAAGAVALGTTMVLLKNLVH